LTSKQRIKNTLNREKSDRVPVNYLSNPGIDLKLKAHFGLQSDDGEGLRCALGVDIRGIGAAYTGPPLHEQIPDRRTEPCWGWRTRYVEHGAGSYWDYCDFPLKDASEEEVARWPMPSPDDYDYDSLEARCREHEEYGIHIGGAGLGCIMNTAGFFRSMDQIFIDLALQDPAGMLLIDRFLEVHLKKAERELDKVGHLVDFMWMGEDLGTQRSPMISMEMFKSIILPRHQPFIDLAKSYNIPVMIHTCGSSSWTYDEYIKAGITVFDTLQPEATDMSPEYLVSHFGNRASFHGGISTTNELSFGTVTDVENHVKHTLEVMMPYRGYVLSPAHSIQDNSPLENVLAMYETAERYGIYR
jgi:uroporphyrinogen decarboxylase